MLNSFPSPDFGIITIRWLFASRSFQWQEFECIFFKGKIVMILYCYFWFKIRITEISFDFIFMSHLCWKCLSLMSLTITHSLYPQSQITVTLITKNNVRLFFFFWQCYSITPGSFSVGLGQELRIWLNSLALFCLHFYYVFFFMVM